MEGCDYCILKVRLRFNRTIVELRQENKCWSISSFNPCFNRTIVELRPSFNNKTELLCLSSFNRTIVELRLVFLVYFFDNFIPVLIEP